MESNNEKPKCRRGKKCFLIPFFILAAVLVKSVIVYFLWNALMPDLFHLPNVDYLQALGLVVLAKVLFGCGFGPHRHHRFGRHCHQWHGLSEEERLKLREEIQKRGNS